MIRKLHVLGLALVTAFAMSVIVSSVASAAIFTATKGDTIKAQDMGNVKFTFTEQSVSCGQVTYTGTAPGVSFESITVAAVFNECSTAFTTVKVTGFGQFGEANKCTLIFRANGRSDLICDPGADVTIDAGPCVVHIPGQQGLATLTYTNGYPGVYIAFNVTVIKSTHTDGFLCPFGSSGESMSGVLEGSVLAAGSSGLFSWDT